MKKQLFIIILLLVAAITIRAQQDDFPKLAGPYLGQRPLGKTPQLFAPGIISVDENFEHSAAVFSPDGTEVFWCTNVDWYTDNRVLGNLRLYTMKIVEGYWTAPKPAPFVKDIHVERPVFSPDGNRLYFECGSDPADMESDRDIYVVERTEDGWSKPSPLSPLINSPAIERLHCVTADGSLYFTRNLMASDEKIYVSRYKNGAFREPEELGEDYNSDDYEIAMAIAPDEAYMLIWQNRAHHQSYLTISYRLGDGSWSERIRAPYYCGGFLALSPDEKYLFFENEGIRWVSTSFIDELKPKNLK